MLLLDDFGMNIKLSSERDTDLTHYMSCTLYPIIIQL
jgi:hypothetical protein